MCSPYSYTKVLRLKMLDMNSTFKKPITWYAIYKDVICNINNTKRKKGRFFCMIEVVIHLK